MPSWAAKAPDQAPAARDHPAGADLLRAERDALHGAVPDQQPVDPRRARDQAAHRSGALQRSGQQSPVNPGGARVMQGAMYPAERRE